MKIEGYEEISEKEYWDLPENEGLQTDNAYIDKIQYFKKIQKFPIFFENKTRKITVDDAGINIRDKEDNELVYFWYNEDFQLLVKAVEKAKEVMEKRL